MTVKLEETASLLTEVTNVFNPEEDLKETAKFQSVQAKIQTATKNKQSEMADIIKGALTARERQRDKETAETARAVARRVLPVSTALLTQGTLRRATPQNTRSL